MAQPIDDRVLLAAQRAVARARGQEFSMEIQEEAVSPDVSAKLYRLTNTAEIEPVGSVAARTGGEKQITASHEPVKVSDRQHRSLFSRINGDGANIVVPRGGKPDRADFSVPVAQDVQDELVPVREKQETPISPVASVEMPERTPVEYDQEEADTTAEIPRVRLMNSYTKSGLTAEGKATAEAASVFLDTFFAQLQRCGVRNVVVSPGIQSTPLAMKAYERYGDVHMNADERSAAYYALGLAKATGNAVALICSGGTSIANWLPAVLEAEASRVPLLLLTADKPARLQGLGVLGACDQLHFFGNHVKKFIQMPLPSLKEEVLSYASQMALEACIAAHGALPNVASADSGPVHINFPFENPLVPSKSLNPVEAMDLPAAVIAGQGIMPVDAAGLFKLISGKRVIALCGEGTCSSVADARLLLNFAHMRNIPLLADPLSGLRCFADSMIIDHYDAIFGGDRAPHAEVVIRFGRWPISDRVMEAVESMKPIQIVVDMRDTRDVTSSTDLFVRCAPTVFCEAMTLVDSYKKASRRSCKEWQHLNNEASKVVRSVRLRDDNSEFEGTYVYEAIEAAPDQSLIWCANSMSVRALDTFYCKSDKQLKVLCNRGLGGIDGTLSSALGAAQAFAQTTLITGDMAFLQDINALSLQNEFRLREVHGSGKMPSVIIVLLNNNGAGIFDTMPQKSAEPYFERLFLAPQSVDFKRIADGFGVTFRTVTSVYTFRRTYSSLIGEPGINIIEVALPLAGMKDRYRDFRKI